MEKIIDKLLEKSNHGTRREDVEIIWNSAIEAAALAVESSDHNDDDSGHSANCNAMISVEKLLIK